MQRRVSTLRANALAAETYAQECTLTDDCLAAETDAEASTLRANTLAAEHPMQRLVR